MPSNRSRRATAASTKPASKGVSSSKNSLWMIFCNSACVNSHSVSAIIARIVARSFHSGAGRFSFPAYLTFFTPLPSLRLFFSNKM